ncbi:hypothetical protein Q4S45_05050 [Massilia sp. R2A-15]|uniref:hypothetical protein n=1 Tax=Massilia sp. R2A-15 TaxID=3064278 RepID=UPI0027368001|nr:hypothetical protein [Massilia sp. R2A-15]WLI90492.1 hypothetical protein Q4S45_05050 [Massilia sp. R2A-15]
MKKSHLVRIAVLALLLLLILWLIPRPSAAAPADPFEQRCERDMRPTIVVRTHAPDFVVHNSLSSRVLTNKGAYTSAGEAMMGMTSSSTRAEIYVDGPALVDVASGRECIAPRIDVELSYHPLDVYVAREFHPMSCSYRAVFEHEMQHVKIYADNLPRIERRVREELRQRYEARPLLAPLHQGLDMLQGQIDNWLRPLITAELAKVEVEQRALDTRAETERLSHSCLGEVAAQMGSSF